MRILLVSAHFPPNFISGGTLAPQRQAHGLRGMGHDVSVYAGWLGSRPALEAWTSTDATGMSVRWVVTSPWTEYGSRTNYDNPSVAVDFARHVQEERPDLVHFHSVQTLGAGLLDVAADAGVKVVVTMHDFWWWCARQFFVTRDFQPCCLVVSCGVCPCEVDSRWLARRNARLAQCLLRADAVLAVSPSAGEVLAANGVDPARLHIDENGLPRSVRPAGERRDSGRTAPAELRFTYTGGHLRLKGVHVLLDATRQLAPLPGWRLTAYGAAPFVEETGLDVTNLPLELRPPFDPAETDAVFASTDVLVVPSVMRETYSLVTREALTRGVPVVCTDSLGPEEVVTHDHNGLVVPSADSSALARSLRRLVQDPSLVERLRRGCLEVRVRSVEEQVAGLDRLYRDLLAPAPLSSPETPGRHARGPIRRVLFLAGLEGAPLRYRARLPAEALRLLGVHCDVLHYRNPEAVDLAGRADALVVYRVPATVQLLELMASIKDRGVPVFFDVDDLIFDPDLASEIPALSILPKEEAELWMEGVRRYRTTMEACDVFIGSTSALCRHAEAVSGLPTERFGNGVGIALGRLSDAALSRPRSPGPPRVGYLSGTKTHDHDWRHVEPSVVRLLDDHPDVEAWLVGHVRPSEALERFGPRVRRLPVQDWWDLPGVLRDLDVNLAPLQLGGRFNDAKSAIKWLEAGLTATPTVASPSEPFREVIRHGHNGMLAATEDEWSSTLRSLVCDAELRQRLGRRARRDALLHWSPHLQASRYLRILEEGPRRRRQRPPAWEAVVHDEPFILFPLEPYDDGLDPSSAGTPHARELWRRVGQARWLGHKAWRSLLEHGPVEAARKTMVVSKRGWRIVNDRRRLRHAARVPPPPRTPSRRSQS